MFFVQNINKSSFFKENPVFLGLPSYSAFCMETRTKTSSKCQLVLETDGDVNG